MGLQGAARCGAEPCSPHRAPARLRPHRLITCTGTERGRVPLSRGRMGMLLRVCCAVLCCAMAVLCCAVP